MPMGPGGRRDAIGPGASTERRPAPSRPLADAVLLLALVAAAALLWRTPLIFPVKAFVVLLHETGHAAAAVLTGGTVDRIELSADLGGACWSAGGWSLVVLPAGYLGSMAFGGLILVAASRWRRDRVLAAALGLVVLVLTVVLVRSLFGVLFGVAFAAAMLASSRWLPAGANDVILRFLGLASVLYAVIDIKEDLVSRTVAGSDAHAMSQMLFLPPVFWGVLWMALAVGAAIFFLVVAGKPRPPAPRREDVEPLCGGSKQSRRA